jgi:glycine cleavage system H protein
MTAGLVAYKLCDRQLDCDACPFHLAMRGGVSSVEADEGSAPARTREWAFPDDRRYHSGHTWAVEIGNGRVRMGLDSLAAGLLEPTSSVILPPRGSRMRRGSPTAWVADERELVPVRAPVSGSVVRGNPRLREEPRLVSSHPYGSGWLLEVRCDGRPSKDRTLRSAEQMRKRSERQLDQLRLKAAGVMSKGTERVGATLADGGERLDDLRRMLGGPAYLRLVAELLRK